MKSLTTFLLACTVAISAGQAFAEDENNDLRVYWKDGLRMENADKSIKIKMGGRIMNDWTFFDSADEIEAELVEELKDGTEFRRARFYIAGEVYDSVIFKAQYDFAGGDADFRDVYIGLKNAGPLGKLTIGHQF